MEPDENEEEDVDFNPFLKETLSSEASSSLSSENEGVGVDVVDNPTTSSPPNTANISSKLVNLVHDIASRDSDNDEEVVMQTRLSPERSCGDESEVGVQQKLKKRKLENASSQDEIVKEALPDPRNPRTSNMDADDEGAIAGRTRARHSLASFTLDELETFLQESDDEADLQYVDDEEEYKKFLAAVLQGGDSEGQAIEVNETVGDEDEENDADFEIEIEEALESDLDESQPGKGLKNKHEGIGRRPETRQNRRQKVSVHAKRNAPELVKRPLRPLLPLVPNTQLDLPRATPETGPNFSSCSAQSGLINGFTRHQIGQLYCLIHEHMQLLIQVFSLCVLEPSRQHIANDVQRMISEMVHKRDEVLARRNVPYPGSCFHHSHIHSSVSNEAPQSYQGEITADSSFASNAQKECPSANKQVGPPRTAESSLWVPVVSSPVLSLLDVVPLKLVGGYVAEVSTVVQKYQQRHVEGGSASPFEKEPLFPLPTLPSMAESTSEVLRGSTSQCPSTTSGHQQPKKTLAATLVESTKKQSVAPVQKDIVKLVQRFFPLFNSALFPHKPPPVAVANRVLFTDAEDELLALGLMEYNTDWKAIQQRFLPCKSKHQIFVRQKNRCSSKAPENPIKAVRRMKTSPLTAEEKARIHEGLRVFKLDWMSIWKFIVPYRDPSLLPRQWRVALGIQKSYKSDAAKKEKRRLYESMRRKSKAARVPCCQIASEEDYPVDTYGVNNSGDDNVDDEDEAYVHEAFLADWRPENSSGIYSEAPQSNFNNGDRSGYLSSQNGAFVGGKLACYGNGYGETQSNRGHMHEVLHSSVYPQHLPNTSPSLGSRYNSSNFSNQLTSNSVSKSAKRQVHLRPYRVRRNSSLQLVKLAPDLPPVNLPPSVRVISQSAFRSYCSGSSSSTKIYTAATAGGGSGSGHAAVTGDQVARLNIARSGTTHSVNAGKDKSFPINPNNGNPCSEVSGLAVDQHVPGEKRGALDLQMHPLLFQAPEDGCFPYYPLNSGASSGTLNLLPGNQLQANFDLLSKPQSVGQIPCTPGTIEFHPLLQKADDVNADSIPALEACQRSVDLESLHGHCTQPQNPESSVLTEPQVRSDLSASCTIPVGPASPSDKNSELDLEIHLSSTSTKEKAMGNRAITEHNSSGLKISGADCGHMMQNQRANGPSYQSGNPHHHGVSVASKYSNRGSPQGACPVVLASSNLNGCDEDMTEQQSPQEIVMEQEELSDSDDELGEDVQFECEEMADSDSEGSDFEQFVNLQNKDLVSSELGVDVSIIDHDNEQALRTDAHDTEGDTPSCKSGSSSKSALQVSVDSQAPVQSSSSKPKSRFSGKGDDQIGRSSQNGLPPRPSRSCKRVTPNSSSELHNADMPNQQSVGTAEGTVVYTPTTKPRRRASRNNYPKGNSNFANPVCHPQHDGFPKVENDARVSNPVSSSALLIGGNTGVQGLREVSESKLPL